MAIIIVTLIIVIGFYLYYHFTKYNNYWKEQNVAGPEPTFFFGNLKEYVLRRQAIGVVFKDIYDDNPEDKVVGILAMRSPELLVRDLDIVKSILIKDFDVFSDRGIEFSKTGLGANLFHADGDTWSVLRNRFTPLFTSGKLKKMTHLMIERSDKLVDYLDNIIELNREQEVHGLTQKFTHATIAACIFGLDFDIFNKEHETLRRIDEKIFTVNLGRDVEIMYPGILKTFGGSLFPREITSFFYNLVKDVIKQRNGEPTDRNDFMDLVLALRKEKHISGRKRDTNETQKILNMTDEIIAAQAFILYGAGYETSASTMGFLLYQLALNPEIQEKIVTEITAALAKYNGNLTYEGIMELSYLSKVFDETLRMYPIVPDLRRCSNRTYKIPGTDITVKSGQRIKIPVLGIHWDEKIYPNPEVFDPERFSPEQVATRHSCAYLPFGAGPRNCIGMRMAHVMSRVCLVKLLSRFRVEPSENTPLHFKYEPKRLVLYPEGGFPLNFVKRE